MEEPIACTIPEEGHQRPSRKYLNRYVMKPVGSKWYNLGIDLLEEDDIETLNTIQSEHQTDFNICCTKMFQLWLSKQPTASWNQLIESLRQPGVDLHVLATRIKQMLLQHNAAAEQPKPHTVIVELQSTLISVTSLNADFSGLLLNVCQILSNCPNQHKNLETCKEYCLYLRIGDNSNESLFSAEKTAKIKDCSNFKQLFEIVSQHMSWDEHSILTQIVYKCNSVEGQQEIEKFEKKLALYQGLEIISSTSQQNLSEDFARFCIIINKPYKSVTVEEYTKVKAYIFSNLKTHAYVTVGFIRMLYHSLHIEWIVTTQAVPHMIKNGRHIKDVFIQQKFVFMQIGVEAVIDNEGLFAQLLSSKQIFDLKGYLVKQETYITKITKDDDVASSDRPLILEHFELSRTTSSTTDSFDEQTTLHEAGYFKPFTVASEFSRVTEQVTKLLQSLDPKLLVEQCRTIMASDGIKLFSDDQIKQLNPYSDTPLLLQHLSHLWSWSNHSVLRVLVGFCDEAIKLLDEFNCHLDPFEQITSYPIFEILPNDVDITTQTVLNVKFTEGTSKITLQDVFNKCSHVTNMYGISQYCLQLIATQQAKGFIIIYWSIPKCIVNLICNKTLQCSSNLYDMGVLEVKIYPDIKIVTGATLDFEEGASRIRDLTKQLRHVHRQYICSFDEVKRLKQDESVLLTSLKTWEQKFKELEKQYIKINEDQERKLKERIASQESEYIEALEKVTVTLSRTADVGKTKEEAFETTTAMEKLQHLGYETDNVKGMIEHTHCYARKVKEQHLALYEICKGSSSSDQKALQQSSENLMIKAELETLRQEYHQLIDIHTKSKIQKDKISIATQTEVLEIQDSIGPADVPSPIKTVDTDDTTLPSDDDLKKPQKESEHGDVSLVADKSKEQSADGETVVSEKTYVHMCICTCTHTHVCALTPCSQVQRHNTTKEDSGVVTKSETMASSEAALPGPKLDVGTQAALKAFNAYRPQLQMLDAVEVGNRLIRYRLISRKGGTQSGGAVHLPNEIKMNLILPEIERNISLNGPEILLLLATALSELPSCVELSTQLKEMFEHKRQALIAQQSQEITTETTAVTTTSAAAPNINEDEILTVKRQWAESEEKFNLERLAYEERFKRLDSAYKQLEKKYVALNQENLDLCQRGHKVHHPPALDVPKINYHEKAQHVGKTHECWKLSVIDLLRKCDDLLTNMANNLVPSRIDGSTNDWIHLCEKLKVNSESLFHVDPNERLINIIQQHQQQTDGPAMTVRCLYITLKSINARRAASLLRQKALYVYEQRKKSASESQSRRASPWGHRQRYEKHSASFTYGNRQDALFIDSPSESDAEADGDEVTTVAVAQSITLSAMSSTDNEFIEITDNESPRNV